jgi:hypothetical protein
VLSFVATLPEGEAEPYIAIGQHAAGIISERLIGMSPSAAWLMLLSQASDQRPLQHHRALKPPA